jgi:hemerythrin
MGKFELSIDMLTDIDDIDNQHLKLLSWANELSSDDTETAVKKVDEALGKLTRYVGYHFRDEEKAMDRYGYNMVEKHHKQHKRLMLEVDKLAILSKKKGPSRGLLVELQYQFEDWFLYHIKEWDQPFAAFLKSSKIPLSFSLSEEGIDVDWTKFDWTKP